MTTDCTADFVVEDYDSASADIRINSSGAKTRPGQHRPSGGPPHATTKGLASKLHAEDLEPLDPHRLSQRQKMIDKGKNTLGYQRYLKRVPRAARTQSDPATPDIAMRGSKRRFDGQVQAWRRQLHTYDEEGDDAIMAAAGATGAGAGSGTVQAAKPSGPLRNTPGSDKRGGSGRGQARVPEEDEEDGYVMVDRNVDGESEESQGSLDAYLGPAYKGGEKKKQGLKRSLDTSTAPPPATGATTQLRSGLRAQAAAWLPQSLLSAQKATIDLEPQPKRSANTRSMDASMLASTCSNPPLPTTAAGSAAPKGAPTTFAGLGLASKVVGGPTGTAGGVHGSYVAAASKATKTRVPLDPADNVVALILGPDAGSCMSWASDA